MAAWREQNILAVEVASPMHLPKPISHFYATGPFIRSPNIIIVIIIIAMVYISGLGLERYTLLKENCIENVLQKRFE